MTALKAFIAKHAAPAYFALAFGISWGGVLIVIGPGGFPGTREQFRTLFPFVFLAMLAGPSVAGMLLTSLVHGSAGFRESWVRLIRWRVGARWYAVALLTAPLLMTTTLFALSFTAPIFLPGILTSHNRASLMLSGIAVGLGAGVFEEIGWTGFVTPALRRRYGLRATALTVGMAWGAWHFLVNVWASGSSAGALSLPLFLPAIFLDLLVGVLPAYRVLMVWVYDRTESLLVAVLMHASLTTSTLILGPAAISGAPLLIADLALAAVLWVVAVAATWTGSTPVIDRHFPRRASSS